MKGPAENLFSIPGFVMSQQPAPGFFVEVSPGIYQYYALLPQGLPPPLPTQPVQRPIPKPVPEPPAHVPKPLTENSTLKFSVNGRPIVVQNPSPQAKLVEFLRDTLGLVGTKRSCGEAGCGACTVMMTEADGTSTSINSCIRPICSLNGKNITTIEGIGNLNDPNPISKTLAADNGTQCGFCSPGMVMNMYSLLEGNEDLSELEIQKQMDGNLCRCTGYRSILKAMCSFAPASSPTPPSSFRSTIPNLANISVERKVDHVTTHRIAPISTRPLSFKSLDEIQYSQPTSLAELYDVIALAPQWNTTMLMRGNSSRAVYPNWNPQNIIDVQAVTELNQISVTSSSVTLGGAVTVAQLIATLTQLLPTVSSQTNAKFTRMLEHLDLIANHQVRNVASLAGNLMMVHRQSFVSDLFVVLTSALATVTITTSPTSSWTLSLDKFLTFDMKKAVLTYVTIPFAQPSELTWSFKVMQRHVNSHAIVNAGFSCTAGATLATPPLICFGGVSEKPTLYPNTAQYLVGKPLVSAATLQGAMAVLQTEIKLAPMPTSDPQYRQSLVFSLFYKWYLSILPPGTLPQQLNSVVNPFVRPKSYGEQSFETDKLEYPVSEPVNKIEGLMQTTGTLPYTDDVPVPANCLHVAFVKSTHAKATLGSINWSPVLGLPGVVGCMDGTSLPAAQNQIGPSVADEPLFTTGPILFNGQPLGMVIADTQQHAEDAARAAQNWVTYSAIDDASAILSLEEGIAQSAFFPANAAVPSGAPLNKGDVNSGFAASQHVISGTVSCGHQYHFHMETQTHLAEPAENNGLNLTCSSQWPQLVAQLVSRTCGIPQGKINVNVLRCGGAYGGKITRVNYPAVAVAVAAQKFGVPVKTVMSIQDNMEVVGKRAPTQCNYKIGFNSDGKIQALQVYFYQDGGSAYDTNPPLIGLMLQQVDNCYYLPNFAGDGATVFTNTPPNTAARGPGWLPATYVMEAIMEQVALTLNTDPWVVKEANFYKNGQITQCGQKIQYFTLDKIWAQLKESSQFTNRLNMATAYNKNNKWTKRGISLVPIKFGIQNTGDTQSCLINVYSDGTVQMSVSGIEIGQGLNTKAVQVAALQLGIPMSLISVTSTSTQTNPNAQATGSSVTSGVVAGAVMQACASINATLAPFKAKNSAATWAELTAIAIGSGANLSAKGWNIPPAGPDGPFNYESYSACVTEVELDVLTGQMQILRVDILFDCGRSLSPWIDIGQIEGAFVMGLGYMLTEQLIFDPSNGALLTNGTWEYKPPSQLDIPIDFRVALLKNVPNPLGILGSKAQGEPPLCLSSSVLFALEHAVAGTLFLLLTLKLHALS